MADSFSRREIHGSVDRQLLDKEVRLEEDPNGVAAYFKTGATPLFLYPPLWVEKSNIINGERGIQLSGDEKVFWRFKVKGNGSWLLGPTPSTLVLERDYLYWNVKASGFRTTKLSVASNLEMTSVDMHGKDICVEVDVAKKEMVLFVNDEEKGRLTIEPKNSDGIHITICGFCGTRVFLEEEKFEIKPAKRD